RPFGRGREKGVCTALGRADGTGGMCGYTSGEQEYRVTGRPPDGGKGEAADDRRVTDRWFNLLAENLDQRGTKGKWRNEAGGGVAGGRLAGSLRRARRERSPEARG